MAKYTQNDLNRAHAALYYCSFTDTSDAAQRVAQLLADERERCLKHVIDRTGSAPSDWANACKKIRSGE